MSSREIAVDMGVYPDVVEEGHKADSLASGLAHSRTRNPEDPVRFSDLVHLGRTACRVIMTQRGTGYLPRNANERLAWSIISWPETMISWSPGWDYQWWSAPWNPWRKQPQPAWATPTSDTYIICSTPLTQRHHLATFGISCRTLVSSREYPFLEFLLFTIETVRRW